jgi:hypothetical protein
MKNYLHALNAGLALGLAALLCAFFPNTPPPQGACSPEPATQAYTFLNPGIINIHAAYAPFFLKWADYYQNTYFDTDIQRKENLEEWRGRFCNQPSEAEIEAIVYHASVEDLNAWRLATIDKGKDTPLPLSMEGNRFAELVAIGSCAEIVDYLLFARECEPYVVAQTDLWSVRNLEVPQMEQLIEKGRQQFKKARTPFIRLRYAFQIIRLAHYAKQWEACIALYDELVPTIDYQKHSIIFYWTLGHLAGALQQKGYYPQAAYRYALIFRKCPSKRAQAFRSFVIRNDEDWNKTLRLCQTDAERATCHILRAGSSPAFAMDDIRRVYQLDPGNPQLDILLTGSVQRLEHVFLSTRAAEIRDDDPRGSALREKAALHLLQLTDFVRTAIHEKRTPNLKLWQCLIGYLELLAGDYYSCEKTMQKAADRLQKDLPYDAELLKQLEQWKVVLSIVKINPTTKTPDEEALAVRNQPAYQSNPYFPALLSDWLSMAYRQSDHPGKAILAAYEPAAIDYNPTIAIYDDLIREAKKENPLFLEKSMQLDTFPQLVIAQLIDKKGALLLAEGKLEAALLTLQQIPESLLPHLPKFSPFREVTTERIHRLVRDTLYLNRREIVEKMIEFEFKAKAAEANRQPVASWYYYLNGLACYNMSYFGYAYNVLDAYRSGASWSNLAVGPVFPMPGSPSGNREYVQMDKALSYFDRALKLARNPELAARAAFMAARCRQKQWLSNPDCSYKPGNQQIPTLPSAYQTYYDILNNHFRQTNFYKQIIQECRWFAAYAR